MNGILRELGGSDSITIIDPSDVLCTPLSCEAHPGSEPLYVDHNHLSVLGAMRLVPLIEASSREAGAPG